MRQLKFVCEEWKDVPYFEGYQVSNLGRVRGIDRFRKGRNSVCLVKGKELKQLLNKKGYPEVRLCKKGCHTRLVHKLVAMAFMTKPEGCTQINHINGIKTDNSLENLEWVNQSQNQLHAYKLGLQPSRAGEGNGRSTITDEKVSILKELYNSGKTTREVSDILNINLHIVRGVIYGKTWKVNKNNILKRDDRSNKSIESIEKIIKTRLEKNLPLTTIVQLSKEGKQLNIFRSINYASKMTSIPRKSIEAVVNKKQFYSKDKSKSWEMKEAGGYIWKKL